MIDRRRKYDWQDMKIGDERRFEWRASVRIAAHLYAKRHGWKLTTRKDGPMIVVRRVEPAFVGYVQETCTLPETENPKPFQAIRIDGVFDPRNLNIIKGEP